MTITSSLHGHDQPEYYRLWLGPTLLACVDPDVDIDRLIGRCEIIYAATRSLSAVRIEIGKANAELPAPDVPGPYDPTAPF